MAKDDTDVLSEGAGNCIAKANPDSDGNKDHPEGAAIRRQVEFYFSDENLPSDLHMLQCCGGRQNIPISVNRICGFKKMRSYKPRALVLAALRKSAFLDVSADGKTIKRKIPFQGKCMLDPDYFDDDDEIAYESRIQERPVYQIPGLLQIKPEHPQGLSKNMLKPTGFEHAYVEPPQTSQEAIEEEALYDPDKPFVERIEIAIECFKQKRRMHQKYAHVFDKLMRFGGVEYGPRMYQGLSRQEVADMDAEERVRALATHSVPWNRSDEKKWVVDFVSVGKAFLSSWYPAHYGFTLDTTKNACQVLRSFYNYLLYHKVCPEYTDELEIARGICDAAERELPKVNAAGLALPGDFNKSASVIFGGAHAGMYTGDQPWAEELKKDGIDLGETGIRKEEANIKFHTGVAIIGTDEQYEMVETARLKVLSDECIGLEVIHIEPPTETTRACYIQQSRALRHKLEPLEPLGRLICKTWCADDCDEWDLPRDNDDCQSGNPTKPNDNKRYEFWIEQSILVHCFVGMKLDARVLTLGGGMTVLDDVKEVMCSFFTWLPNELWMERKPKEVRWLNKGTGVDEDEVDIKINKESQDNGEFDDELDDE